MIAVEQFLSNLEPFDYMGNLNQFLEELEKIPNYYEKLAKEIENNSQWLTLVEKTRDEHGYHVFFFLDHLNSDHGLERENELSLRIFSNGKQPIIKVMVYGKV